MYVNCAVREGRRDITHICDQTCSNGMASSPCVSTGIRIPCVDCDRHFRSQEYFANHKKRNGNKKPVCEGKRTVEHAANSSCRAKNTNAANSFATCASRGEVGHLCYTQPLKTVLPPSEGVLYVFYNFETTQNTRYSDTGKVHVHNLVCIQ